MSVEAIEKIFSHVMAQIAMKKACWSIHVDKAVSLSISACKSLTCTS